MNNFPQATTKDTAVCMKTYLPCTCWFGSLRRLLVWRNVGLVVVCSSFLGDFFFCRFPGSFSTSRLSHDSQLSDGAYIFFCQHFFLPFSWSPFFGFLMKKQRLRHMFPSSFPFVSTAGSISCVNSLNHITVCV